MITNLIKSRMRKLMLNYLICNNCPEFPNGFLDSHFFRQTLGNDCVEFASGQSFQKHLDSVILQITTPFQTRALNTMRCIHRFKI